MKWSDWLFSLMFHGAMVGAVMVAGVLHIAPEQNEGPVPIYFEVVEAATMDVAESDVGSVPHGDSKSAPIQEEAVEGSGPIEDTGSVPIQEDNTTHEYEPEPSEIDDMPDRQNEGQPQSEEPESVEGEDQPTDEDAHPQEESESLVAAQEERARIVSDPVALNRIVPVYPRSARRKGHEGSVTVEISVAKDGIVSDAEVVMSSGFDELDAAALGAVRTARFTPATEDGVSVSGRLRLTFDFRLR